MLREVEQSPYVCVTEYQDIFALDQEMLAELQLLA